MDLLTPATGNKETEDSRALKIAMVLAIPFFVSFFKSCDDLGYRMSGKTATALITQIVQSSSRGGDDRYQIFYTFTNANTQKSANGFTVVGADEVQAYAVGQNVTIDYRGDDVVLTRIQGTGGWFWQAFFVVSLVGFTIFTVVMTIRSGRQDRRRRPASRGLR